MRDFFRSTDMWAAALPVKLMAASRGEMKSLAVHFPFFHTGKHSYQGAERVHAELLQL